MTMENSGHEQTKPAVDNVQPPAAKNVPNPSRRRFNRAGVGASAVVMTLASRSVLANMACTTPSGFYSANMSHHGRAEAEKVQCRGLDPQGWLATREWIPARTDDFTKTFGSNARDELTVGPPVAPLSKKYSDNDSGTLKLNQATLEQALAGRDTPLVVKHLIAALLNARSNKSTNPSADIVLEIFAKWNAGFTYEVSGGVQWGTREIIEYLSYTQTPGPLTYPTRKS